MLTVKGTIFLQQEYQQHVVRFSHHRGMISQFFISLCLVFSFHCALLESTWTFCLGLTIKNPFKLPLNIKNSQTIFLISIASSLFTSVNQDDFFLNLPHLSCKFHIQLLVAPNPMYKVPVLCFSRSFFSFPFLGSSFLP